MAPVWRQPSYGATYGAMAPWRQTYGAMAPYGAKPHVWRQALFPNGIQWFLAAYLGIHGFSLGIQVWSFEIKQFCLGPQTDARDPMSCPHVVQRQRAPVLQRLYHYHCCCMQRLY